jgi:hypothetical protein
MSRSIDGVRCKLCRNEVDELKICRPGRSLDVIDRRFQQRRRDFSVISTVEGYDRNETPIQWEAFLERQFVGSASIPNLVACFL